MTLIDDLALPLTEEELGRRKALGLIGAGAITVACAGTGITSVQYIAPNVLYETSALLKVGPVASIPRGAVLSFPKQKTYVVRNEHGIIAMSTTCTHLGCMTSYEAAHNRIFCPCHGSQYSLDGKVVGGPAPRALPRLHIEERGGVLVVDTRKVVAPDFVFRA